LNDAELPISAHVKYLEVYLDEKLIWRTHIEKKREEVKLRFRSLYWLLHSRNKLSLENKRLLYLSVIRPIRTYTAPVWGSAANANVEILQRTQNLNLRKMTGAP